VHVSSSSRRCSSSADIIDAALLRLHQLIYNPLHQSFAHTLQQSWGLQALLAY